MRVALEEEEGAVYLFDFAAAFPSISHKFLFRSLRRLGLPDLLLNYVGALYDNTSCLLTHAGTAFRGFQQTAGIR